jgi:SAM-dependent methyltransferase
MAESKGWNIEIENWRNGKPLFLYRLLLLVREVLQPGRLSQNRERENSTVRGIEMSSPDTSNQLQRLYSSRFDSDADYRQRVWKILASFFSQYIKSDATVLDLGCGYGGLINNVDCRKKLAMDLNPGVRGHLNPDVTFIEQDSSEKWNIEEGTLDVVFSSNFFEHIRSKQDLSATIAEAARCMRPGGRLIAIGPNIRFVGNRYWDFWDHHLPLTEASLTELVEIHHLQVERAVDRFLPYSMVNQRQAPSALVSLYLRLPLLWKVFGKQFLVVATKAGRNDTPSPGKSRALDE